MGVQLGAGGAGYFEPEATHQFLPRCRNCHAPHPLAVRTVADKNRCHVCAEPSLKPDKPITQVAALGEGIKFNGITVGFASLMITIGRGLHNLSKRI
jgi:hypothetical protein